MPANGLLKNKHYFFRTKLHLSGSKEWVVGKEAALHYSLSKISMLSNLVLFISKVSNSSGSMQGGCKHEQVPSVLKV